MGEVESPLRRRARAVASVTLALFAIVQASQFTGTWGRLSLGGLFLGGDFVVYYQAGVILDRHGGDRLYDLDLQGRIRNELFPTLSKDTADYFLYAPWLVVLVRPLARLPYATAVGVWLALNLTLCLMAIRLAWGRQPIRAGVDRSTAALVALSWYPCLLFLLYGGQSALPAFAVALAAACDRAERPVLAGLALALTTYKPTLAAPVVLMLLVAGRWRSLAGFAAGVLGSLALSWAGTGIEGIRGFIRAVVTLAHMRATRPELFKNSIYIDPRSALELLLGHHPAVTGLAAALMLAALAWLAPRWWRAGRDWTQRGESAWARSLCWLPLLAPHLGAYDATLVVPGVLLALRALDRSGRPAWPLAWPVGIVYVAGIISMPLAKTAGLQVLTIALAWLAVRVTRLTTPDPSAR